MPLLAPTKPTIERVVLVHNHTAASRKQAEQSQEEIGDRLGVPVALTQTVAGGRWPNTEHLARILRPGDIVAGKGGDGSARDVILAIGSAPFISLGGGNACDIGRATHRNRNARPSELIRKSVVVSAFALSCIILHEDGVRQEHAISYTGCGETANGSDRLDSPAYRKREKGWRRDFDLGMASMRSDFTFRIRDSKDEEHELSDLTFSKGSRMAKIARFPIRHWDDSFRLTPIGPGRGEKWATAAGLLIGHAAGSYHTEYKFTALSPVKMHFDGEPPIQIQPHNEVTIAIGEEYKLMTSRLDELA